ncbi:hypothetical protein T4A_5242 [Trichinella pseudospiralis]|uniref:Uncharacterized protein n=1 Tax=Trichinella pseudospiralis TaxID=6337 RepID=A0A0V1EF98_TRIPS|nr:hypothetical protein T4A_5242 [Trichinella pseudospiralis]
MAFHNSQLDKEKASLNEQVFSKGSWLRWLSVRLSHFASTVPHHSTPVHSLYSIEELNLKPRKRMHSRPRKICIHFMVCEAELGYDELFRLFQTENWALLETIFPDQTVISSTTRH